MSREIIPHHATASPLLPAGKTATPSYGYNQCKNDNKSKKQQAKRKTSNMRLQEMKEQAKGKEALRNSERGASSSLCRVPGFSHQIDPEHPAASSLTLPPRPLHLQLGGCEGGVGGGEEREREGRRERRGPHSKGGGSRESPLVAAVITTDQGKGAWEGEWLIAVSSANVSSVSVLRRASRYICPHSDYPVPPHAGEPKLLEPPNTAFENLQSPKPPVSFFLLRLQRAAHATFTITPQPRFSCIGRMALHLPSSFPNPPAMRRLSRGHPSPSKYF